MLIHSVYFWLKPELTDAQRAEFRNGVESLRGVKAVDQLYVGAPAAEIPERAVLDKSFSVTLTAVMKDIAAHNSYQKDPLHLAFLDQFRTYWTKVQIYDAE